MPHVTFGRRPLRPTPIVCAAPEAEFALGRAHELCGASRHPLAMAIAARMQGPVFWIRPTWLGERLHPDGIRPYADPSRFLFLDARRPEDLLWATEEVLRAGAVPLVITELPEPPPLTPVRRLHLAAEAGGTTAPVLPLALLLTPGDGGAQGIETRWHMTPAPCSSRWRLTRLRARMQMPRTWAADWIAGKLNLAPADAAEAGALPEAVHA